MRIYRNMKILSSKPLRMGQKRQKYSGGERGDIPLYTVTEYINYKFLELLENVV